MGLTNPPVWPRTLLLTPPSAGLETVVTKSLKTLYDAKTNPMAGTPFFNITTPVSFVIPPFTNDDPVFKKSFPMPDRTITIAVPVKRQSLPSGFRRNVD